jgi:nitroimidazol reductase NimA-like FMN-containing flavoprotein (pyridoxamine 5'-phosphate oxidase superfamily)
MHSSEPTPRRRGPWSEAEIAAFLASIRVPLRLACNGAAGHPLLASLWFLPEDGLLWCATQRAARVAERLAADPRCAFEVSDESAPYRGVRGQGEARLHPERGAEILERLIERYVDEPASSFAAGLRAKAEQEVAVAIVPERILSWDFRARMGRAVAPRTAGGR